MGGDIVCDMCDDFGKPKEWCLMVDDELIDLDEPVLKLFSEEPDPGMLFRARARKLETKKPRKLEKKKPRSLLFATTGGLGMATESVVPRSAQYSRCCCPTDQVKLPADFVIDEENPYVLQG